MQTGALKSKTMQTGALKSKTMQTGTLKSKRYMYIKIILNHELVGSNSE